MLLCGSASAVIVAGANGGGNTSNNTTQAQLESALGQSFPIFDNVLRLNNASGVYLGYNPNTNQAWVLTARHVAANPATLNIGGLNYSNAGRTNLTSDVALIAYTRGDNVMPSLAPVSIASSLPSTSDTLVMIGGGRDRVQDASTDANTSDAITLSSGQQGYQWGGTGSQQLIRWGTNNMEGNNPLNGPGPPNPLTTINFFGGDTEVYTTRFDQPANGEWLTSNQAQGSGGDSGGGAFYFDGQQWRLSGVFTSILSFNDQEADSAAFGNYTVITNLAAYESEIFSITGTLIPEPRSSILLLSSMLILVSRRQRSN